MNKKFNIADEEIILFDDSTGNIVVPSNKIEGVSEEDNIIIHFIEDSDNIVHEYIVRGLETDGVHLEWVKMIDESVLTEANPIDAVKRKLNPTYADRVAKFNKKEAKSLNKLKFAAEKLLERDLNEGQDWKFYIQNSDGTYSREKSYMDVKQLLTAAEPDISIMNAIVVDNSGNIVRRGAEDLMGRGLVASETENLVPNPKYLMPRKSDVTTREEENTQPSEQSKEEPKPQSNQPKQYSDKLLNKLKDIALATGMSIKDPQGKEVDINKESMRNLDLDTYTLTIRGKNYPMRGWIEQAVAKDILTESCDPSTILVESLLFEAPQILFNDAELNNPDNINFKDIVKNRVDAEEQEKAKAAAKEVSDNLKSKYADAIAQFESKKLEDTYYRIENLFDNFVPSSGKADTVGGELVRAMMRILYRDYNDGDKFFEGYGLESCGGSAEFLFDNCPDCAVKINDMLDAPYNYEDDDAYTRAINALCDTLLTYLESHIELFYEPNEEDSREYTNEYIAEHQPTYEFELYGSDDIVELVDKGVLTSWDLRRYVEEQLEYESDYRGAEVANPWSHHDTTVVVTELTKDGYDHLSDAFNHDPEKWWADLVDEHADELETDDEEYDDDYDLSDEE